MAQETGNTVRRLGTTGPEVFPIGLGCMGLGKAALYGEGDPDEGVRTIHAAIRSGVTLLDTGDFYGMGQNELLIRRALAELGSGARDRVVLSVKFGALRGPSGAWLGPDCRPATMKNALAQSLSKLGVDHIDIFRPARLDDSVPIEDTVGAMADMVKQGYIRHIGLSEMSLETLRKAQAVAPICDLQIEYGLASRGIEAGILPGLRALGVGVTAYAVLSRGLLTGATPAPRGDYRKFLPRFTGANYNTNKTLAEALAAEAAERGATASQMALTWVLSRGSDIVPILGARSAAHIEEACTALEMQLTAEELSRLEAAVPFAQVAGARYDKHSMAHLDSERSPEHSGRGPQ